MLTPAVPSRYRPNQWNPSAGRFNFFSNAPAQFVYDIIEMTDFIFEAINSNMQPSISALTGRQCPSISHDSFIDRKVVLIFRADERRRESGPTKLAPTQTAACPWVRAGAVSCLNYAPDRRWQ